jgi:hypothetical protein
MYKVNHKQSRGHILLDTNKEVIEINIDANAGLILGLKGELDVGFDYGIYSNLFNN